MIPTDERSPIKYPEGGDRDLGNRTHPWGREDAFQEFQACLALISTFFFFFSAFFFFFFDRFFFPDQTGEEKRC